MSCVDVVQHLAKHGLNAGQQIKADKDPSYGEGLVDAFNCLQPEIDHLNPRLKVFENLVYCQEEEIEILNDILSDFIVATRDVMNDKANAKLDELLLVLGKNNTHTKYAKRLAESMN